jgi:hypothetical protein
LINRYYDPTTDQFLSVDPDVTTTDKPYVFTNDDPLNVEDPNGLHPGTPFQHGGEWAKGNLQEEIERYLGQDYGIEEGSTSSKIVFYDLDDPGKQVVYDIGNNNYRVVRESNGRFEYFDGENDTWGTDKQLGDQGLANSHYANLGDSYDSLDDAVQQLSYNGSFDGDEGFESGGLGLLFGIFPSVCALSQGIPSECNDWDGKGKPEKSA